MNLNFNRFSVLLMYIMVIGLAIVSLFTEISNTFVICWYCFWCVQALATMTLTINKRKQTLTEKAVKDTIKNLKEENIKEIIEILKGA